MTQHHRRLGEKRMHGGLQTPGRGEACERGDSLHGRVLANPRGFTLIELMIVLAIAAILGTIAAPSMRSLLESNRIAAKINGFVGDLQFARSEAIRHGLPVVVCASADATTCSGANNWQSGWLVYLDADDSRTLNTGDSTLRIRPTWGGNDTFTVAIPTPAPTPAPSTSLLVFSRDGFAVSASGSVRFVLKTVPVSDAATRCVAVNAAGRLKTLTHGVGGCA